MFPRWEQALLEQLTGSDARGRTSRVTDKTVSKAVRW